MNNAESYLKRYSFVRNTIWNFRMLRLKPSNETPPDKFRFKFGDGHTVHAFDKPDWIEKTHKYASDNGYLVPTIEEMEDQLCRTLSGEWCSGGDEYSFVTNRFTFDDFLNGAKALGSFFLKGQVVSPEIAEARGTVCSRCVLNMDVPGCASCSGMANAALAIKGARSTKHDHLLKACAICKCPNQAKIWLPIEVIKKSTTPEMLEQYKRMDECWQKTELANLDQIA